MVSRSQLCAQPLILLGAALHLHRITQGPAFAAPGLLFASCVSG